MSTTGASSTDEVTRAVLRHRFDSIADGMERALVRTSYSNIVKEAEDASSAIFDPEGRTIAQAVATPSHLGMLIPAVRRIVERFPPDEMAKDDVYAMNDPYQGGTHLPDFTVVKPIFSDGDVIALGATMSHHTDVGGTTPGSIPTDATDIYQEGIRIPPVKLYDQGEPNETFLETIRKNTRAPDNFMGDLNAQISACSYAASRMRDVAREYGTDVIVTVIEDLMTYAERLTRSAFEDIPDGTYEFHDFLDDDGIHHHEPIRIQVAVEIDGSDVHVDFTGTADQVDGPVNSVPAATISAVYFAIRMITGPDIPTNSGCFEPVSVHLPERSLVNPAPPSPVNARTVTISRIGDVVLGAFAQAIPDESRAASKTPVTVLSFGRTTEGNSWVYGEILPGGMGARPTKDGVDALDADISNCKNTPVEATELENPLRVTEFSLWDDSGGPGEYRGGLGCRKRIQARMDGIVFTHRRDRHDTGPWGLQGGEEAPKCKTTIFRTDGTAESIPSKYVCELNEGDEVDLFMTGGGGYGAPTDRPLDSVATDVKRGKVSRDVASDRYGIVFDDDGTIDREQSDETRTSAV